MLAMLTCTWLLQQLKLYLKTIKLNTALAITAFKIINYVMIYHQKFQPVAFKTAR